MVGGAGDGGLGWALASRAMATASSIKMEQTDRWQTMLERTIGAPDGRVKRTQS
jgi:hypothetical protein